jgi:hypothetical protein
VRSSATPRPAPRPIARELLFFEDLVCVESLEEVVLLDEEAATVGEEWLVVDDVLVVDNESVDGLVVADCVDADIVVCDDCVVRGCTVSVVEDCFATAVEDCVSSGVEVVGEIMDAIFEARKTPCFEEQHVVLEAPQQKLPSAH